MSAQGDCPIGKHGCGCQSDSAYQTSAGFWALVTIGSAIMAFALVEYFWFNRPIEKPIVMETSEDGTAKKKTGDCCMEEAPRVEGDSWRSHAESLLFTSLPFVIGLTFIMVGHMQFHEGGVRVPNDSSDTEDEHRDKAYRTEYSWFVTVWCAEAFALVIHLLERGFRWHPLRWTRAFGFLIIVRVPWLFITMNYASEVSASYYGGIISAALIVLIVGSITDMLGPRACVQTRGWPKVALETTAHVGLLLGAIVHQPCA